VIYQSYLETSIGFIRILSNGQHLYNVNFQETNGPENPDQITEWTKTQLNEYFHGTRTSFNIPLFLDGSEFESRVWSALQEIPFGTTTSYKSLAQQIARPKSMQAVGSANGKNPIAVIVPCHRVIGHDGDLKGYAGGIERKKWLLKHENSLLL
jgi:methylated-DNA-[protein]-cysteine S-methyltransferase